ncbi:hypothetical protein NtRootA9_05600 [Arthrobacter sp. NtRootA9]|jgi:hypothetical protein|nr:hypothetical protein NtRootA9_05600 [Arthrobacter sp. NtRootA9]
MASNDVQDLSGMGRPISLATAVARGWERAVGALSPRSPYRIGDAVLGDDPFNGRHEGTVVSQEGATVGVKTARGLFFYDHRQLRRLD